MTDSQDHARMTSTRALGGAAAICLFVLTLAAFVIQTSLTQYVQGTLGFRQPFLLLYTAHSSLIIIFPIHLFYLLARSQKPAREYMSSLKAALKDRLSSSQNSQSEKVPFPITRFIGLIFALATGINVPGLLWYAAVSLTSVGDVTALWNTNSFWVYVMTVWLYRLKWEPRKLGAVVMACLGVLLDVYGGSKSSTRSDSANTLAPPKDGPTAPVLGDIMTLGASISYALYQVFYKRYAALPNDPEGDREYDARSFSYESLSEASTTTLSLQTSSHVSPDDDETGNLPFALYPNFITSCMGLCTLVSLAFGFPVLHWLSIERFTLPPDAFTLGCIMAIASAGVIFNSCFMILLGLWGPVLTSVGNLLTIVLVLVTDVLFNAGSITVWSLLGCGMIVAAFGVLVIDMIRRPK